MKGSEMFEQLYNFQLWRGEDEGLMKLSKETLNN